MHEHGARHYEILGRNFGDRAPGPDRPGRNRGMERVEGLRANDVHVVLFAGIRMDSGRCRARRSLWELWWLPDRLRADVVDVHLFAGLDSGRSRARRSLNVLWMPPDRLWADVVDVHLFARVFAIFGVVGYDICLPFLWARRAAGMWYTARKLSKGP